MQGGSMTTPRSLHFPSCVMGLKSVIFPLEKLNEIRKKIRLKFDLFSWGLDLYSLTNL